REHRVGLEDHRDVPVARRQVRDIAVADADGPAVDPLEAREAAEQRRLAAARGPKQDHELAVADEQVHVLERDRLAEDLANGFERDTRHVQLTYPVPKD